MSADLPDEELIQLIILAKNGDEDALGKLLDQHRDQLRRLAESELSQKLSKRVDASDVVQQTYLSVCKKVEQFHGENIEEFVAWIFQIHRHNIKDAARQHVTVAKRNVDLEQSGIVEVVATGHEESTPSQNAIRNEESLQLVEMIEKLPPDQSRAVHMRHIENKTLSEIASELDRSTQAVASLLKRGLEQLRHIKNFHE